MDAQKEALCRIISSLSNKNQELQDFLRTLEWTRTGLQEESCRVMSELGAELDELSSALNEKGAELRLSITEETQKKEAELKMQLKEGRLALTSCEELLDFANSSLSITDEEQFLQAAKEIKERVTMAAAFRISTRPLVTENMSHFTVDFSRERARLQRLHFLPVPGAPQLDVSQCLVKDNCVSVGWTTVDQSGASYELQYRKCHRETPPPVPESEWDRIQDIRDTQVSVSGLKFDSSFIAVRVRARNKAAAGDFSETVVLETPAFNFSFEPATAHPELKVQAHTVTWEPQVKGHDPKIKVKDRNSRSATPSPSKSAAGRASRERFAGESYTVLGDQEISGGGHYWEVRPLGEWKSVSVGVAYRGALSRFVQLGKSPASWSLSLSQWLQTSVSAKHNNRSKSLECALPTRIGVYCHHGNGDLLFIDVEQMRLIHSFRTKFSQPLVPAFTLWCGGVSVDTGLQVPSFMDQFLPMDRSLTNLSQ